MIAMEYAPGGTLYDFIMDRKGVLLEEEVHTVCVCVCAITCIYMYVGV